MLPFARSVTGQQGEANSIARVQASHYIGK
jgi:hypothetical protein